MSVPDVTERRVEAVEREVGSLRADFEGVKADLRGVVAILGDIKTAVNNARPAWHVVALVALPFAGMTIAGVFEFDTLRAEVQSLKTLKGARDLQFEAVDYRLHTLEQRQYDELRSERDALRERQKDAPR